MSSDRPSRLLAALGSLLLSSVASGLAAPTALVGPAPAQPRLDEASLDSVFDGSRRLPGLPALAVGARPARPVIRAEDDPLPPAPRFALDLDAIPPSLRRTVDGFDRLFHKNQEETSAWVERTNALIRRRNAGRILGKVPEWTYDGRPNEPPFTCLSDAAGTVNDWWALQLGRDLPSYVSANNGAVEQGMDPRMLELKYLERARTGDPKYFLLPGFVEKDPVRGISAPQQPLGYAELLVEGKPYAVEDPATGQKYSYSPKDSAMEGRYNELFSNSILRPRTPDKYARVLAEGIEKWGIAYVQLEHTEHPRLSGAHTVAVVGYFCMEESGELVQCSGLRTDEDWGKKGWFIVHDSFGDFPASKVRDAAGGSAYRAVRIGSIDQAIVFPHSLDVSAAPVPGEQAAWRLSVTNKGGRPVQPTALRAFRQDGSPATVAREADGGYRLEGKPGDVLRVEVEARHYFEADGKARSYVLRLGSGKAEELVRTPPAEPYEERRPPSGPVVAENKSPPQSIQ